MSSVYKKNSAPSPRLLRILRESPPAGFPAEFAEGADKTQFFFAKQVKCPRFTKKTPRLLRAFCEFCGNYIPGQNGILDLPLRAFPVLKWRRSYVKDSMTNCRSALVCWSSI